MQSIWQSSQALPSELLHARKSEFPVQAKSNEDTMLVAADMAATIIPNAQCLFYTHKTDTFFSLVTL
jgi:hypothetical protein